MENFYKDPSSAPIKDLTAPVDTKMDMSRDAGVLAIKEMNPSSGSTTVTGAAADLAGDVVKDAVADSVVSGQQASIQQQSQQHQQTPDGMQKVEEEKEGVDSKSTGKDGTGAKNERHD